MCQLKNSNYDKTQKIKVWQNSQTVVIMTVVTVAVVTLAIVTSLSKNKLTPWQPMKCSQGSVLWFLQGF